MNWLDTDRLYQRTDTGEAKAFRYLYIYQKTEGFWIGGRFWFGQEIDFRLRFATPEEARAYCERIDRETVVIEEVRA